MLAFRSHIRIADACLRLGNQDVPWVSIRRIEHSVSQLLTEAFVLGFSADEIVNEIAKRARTILAAVPGAKVDLDTCDEWVNLVVILPVAS